MHTTPVALQLASPSVRRKRARLLTASPTRDLTRQHTPAYHPWKSGSISLLSPHATDSHPALGLASCRWHRVSPVVTVGTEGKLRVRGRFTWESSGTGDSSSMYTTGRTQPASSSTAVHSRVGRCRQPSRRPLGRELRLSLPMLSLRVCPLYAPPLVRRWRDDDAAGWARRWAVFGPMEGLRGPP